MNLKYLTEPNLIHLKTNIEGFLDNYYSDSPWVQEYFENNDWFLQSKVMVQNVELLNGKSASNDIENTIRLYDAFKNLNLVQASDERLWSYLTHTYFWSYTRSRWGIDNIKSNSNPINFIKRRYFLESNKHIALVRNSISRLWWFGYISYDSTREDPYELTKFLLSKQDFAHSLMERTFSRNKKIVNSLLSVLLELKNEDNFEVGQEEFRIIAKKINSLGGVTIIDTLSSEEIKTLIRETFQSKVQQV
ncbi:DUF6339 family protein [Aquibacillus sediminis]|uniref:DUF6339 family protein n=1 Tax=Aquibacillus sediminis TaxID=2574734 RepID=UPI001108889C|nr:DUF6339 family protein [Aquibacillus sediminis]